MTDMPLPYLDFLAGNATGVYSSYVLFADLLSATDSFMNSERTFKPIVDKPKLAVHNVAHNVAAGTQVLVPVDLSPLHRAESYYRQRQEPITKPSCAGLWRLMRMALLSFPLLSLAGIQVQSLIFSQDVSSGCLALAQSSQDVTSFIYSGQA